MIPLTSRQHLKYLTTRFAHSRELSPAYLIASGIISKESEVSGLISNDEMQSAINGVHFILTEDATITSGFQ